MITKIADGVTYGKVGDEGFLTNGKGNTLKLDDQAIMLWEMITKGYNEERLTEHFVLLYPEQKEMVAKDIKDFFEILRNENMIE